MRAVSKLVRCFSKVPRPPNPTVEESFGTKFSKDQVEKFMNPKGFLDPKEFKNYEGVEKVVAKETIQSKEEQSDVEKVAEPKATEIDMTEYGFKIKGLEPTRYGDWERNGRCFDF